MKRINGLVGLAAMAVTGGVAAQSITPDKFTADIAVGGKVSINKTITLPTAGATKVDVFFLIDDTGSMGGIIGNAKSGATAIMNALPSTYRFGAASFDGDPVEGVALNAAFNLRNDLTTDKAAVQAGINTMTASGGGDGPEANNYAMKRAADTLSWDPAAQRLLLVFADNVGHTETVTTAGAAAALMAANVELLAFNSTVAGSGMDGRYSSEPVGTRQASDIIAVAGGKLINSFASLSAAQFVSAVTSEITTASSELDLAFGSTFLGDGLEISFTCTDALGCDDVKGGESRTFRVDITGLKPGEYKFDVFARGVDAIESDVIRVGGVPAIPEPETYALMAMGLAVVGFVSRRRKAAAAKA